MRLDRQERCSSHCRQLEPLLTSSERALTGSEPVRSFRNAQRPRHPGVINAVECDRPRAPDHRLAAGFRRQFDVEAFVARSRGMLEKIPIDPDDRVAGVNSRRHWTELHLVNDDMCTLGAAAAGLAGGRARTAAATASDNGLTGRKFHTVIADSLQAARHVSDAPETG